jgi:phosphatidylinositol glycan class C protein
MKKKDLSFQAFQHQYSPINEVENSEVPSYPSYRTPWRRILYEKQPYYKDNYYDPLTFFNQLRIVKPALSITKSYSFYHSYGIWFRSYSQLVFHSTVIVLQFSAISFFLCIYKYLLRKYISFIHLASLNLLLIIAGIGLFYYYETPWKKDKFSLFSFLKTFLLFIICLKMTSPIIKTLTSSISDDTIEALTIFLAVIHLVFHDYQRINEEKPSSSVNKDSYSTVASRSISSGISPSLLLNPKDQMSLSVDEEDDKTYSSSVLSLSTAIFTAILLASRLDDNNTVVAYIILAVIAFSLFPLMLSLIKQHSFQLFVSFAIVLWIALSHLIFFLDKTLFIAYEVLVILLWFVGPLLYLQMISYKKAYDGPWNIRKIQ